MSFIVEESPVDPVKKTTTHPKVSTMVDEAIKTLAERKGSSLHAIMKYIDANYNADAQKLSPFIKKYLKSAVEKEDIIQPKGKGLTGSFKIKKQKKEAKPKVPKERLKKSPKMLVSTPKKVSKVKKPAAKSPKESPVKKTENVDPQVVPVAEATFIKPKAKAAKKKKISLPTKPRKSLVSVPKKVRKARQLLAKQSPSRQEKTKTSPAMPKKKVDNKSPKASKSPKPVKTAPSIQKKVPAKKKAAKEQK